jgi:hypothetical protein
MVLCISYELAIVERLVTYSFGKLAKVVGAYIEVAKVGTFCEAVWNME